MLACRNTSAVWKGEVISANYCGTQQEMPVWMADPSFHLTLNNDIFGPDPQSARVSQVVSTSFQPQFHFSHTINDHCLLSDFNAQSSSFINHPLAGVHQQPTERSGQISTRIRQQNNDNYHRVRNQPSTVV